ncbi:MAG: hypothetical protein RMJ48_13780 [Roseiflexaceae bacterium]|nr:hypothetical protein [Roseiflexaceae bacterium]
MHDANLITALITAELQRNARLSDEFISNIGRIAALIDVYPPLEQWRASKAGPNDIEYYLPTTPYIGVIVFFDPMHCSVAQTFGSFASSPPEDRRVITPVGTIETTFSVYRRFALWRRIVHDAASNLSEPDVMALAARFCRAHLSELYRAERPWLRRARVTVGFRDEMKHIAFGDIVVFDVPHHFFWQEALDVAMRLAERTLYQSAENIPQSTDVYVEMSDACLSTARYLSEMFFLEENIVRNNMYAAQPAFLFSSDDMRRDDAARPSAQQPMEKDDEHWIDDEDNEQWDEDDGAGDAV